MLHVDIVTNIFVALEIRILVVQNRAGKNIAANLTASMDTPWKEFLCRPTRPLHRERFPHVVACISLQIKGVFGTFRPPTIWSTL